MNDINNYKIYYKSIPLGILIFVIVAFTLPSKLNRHIPEKSTIYVVDTVYNYVDTLTIKTKQPNFQMNTSKSARMILGSLDDSSSYSNFLLNRNPKLLLWIMAQAMGLSLSYALLPFLIRIFSSLSTSRNRKIIALGVSFLGVLLLLGINNFSQRDIVFTPPAIMEKTGVMFGDDAWIMPIIVILYLIPAWLALAANILLGIESIEKKSDTEFERVHEFRTKYLFVLRSASIILVFGIITTSLLQQSILAVIGEKYTILFPDEFVIVYSLNFTFFLVVFYLPVGYLILIQNLQQESKSERSKEKKFDFRMLELLISTFAPILTGIMVEVFK